MEQEIKEDSRDYFTVLPKELTREIIKQLIISEKNNIARDNNGVFFTDGFQTQSVNIKIFCKFVM